MAKRKKDRTVAVIKIDFDRLTVDNANRKRLNNVWWWGGDTAIALLIIAVVKSLRTRGISSPCYPERVASYEEWRDVILPDIEKGFTLYLQYQESWKKWKREDRKAYNRAWFLFKKYFGDLWD